MPDLVHAVALAEREGLSVTKLLKEDYDHKIYIVERPGARYVLKTITRPELQRNLAREIAYLTLLRSLADCQPEWTLRASPPLMTGPGWLLRELVDGSPLLAENDLDRPDAVSRLARALADLDRLAPDPHGLRPVYRDASGEPVEDEAHRVAELERWAGELSQRGAWGDLDPDRVTHAVREGRTAVQPGFEIWDVKLDDFLGLADGKVGLYDLEFAHLYGRRYYDLAKTYATLAVWHGAEAVAGRLLATFLDTAARSPAAATLACLPVLTEVLLAELYDAALSDAADRLDRARALLACCLGGSLPALLAVT